MSSMTARQQAAPVDASGPAAGAADLGLDAVDASGLDAVDASGREQLDALLAAVTEAEAATARAVGLAGVLAGSGVCEKIEGLPLEQLLGVAGRLTGADRRMLVAAGEGLRHLPVTAGLFGEGTLSWGQVRRIVADTRRLPVAARAQVTHRSARPPVSTAALPGSTPMRRQHRGPHPQLLLRALDQLTDAVTAACERLRDASSVERREQQRSLGSFCTVQQTLDGWVEGFFRCDPVLGAGIVNALDAAADQPTADAAAGGEPEAWGTPAPAQDAGTGHAAEAGPDSDAAADAGSDGAAAAEAGPDAGAGGAAAPDQPAAEPPDAGDADWANGSGWDAV